MTIFPLIKRFSNIKELNTTAILKIDSIIHDKGFRAGSIFEVVRWKDINNKKYMILAKGSWEGLVDYEEYIHKLENL